MFFFNESISFSSLYLNANRIQKVIEFILAAENPAINNDEIYELFKKLPISAAERWMKEEDRLMPKILLCLKLYRPQMHANLMRL